jgi:hypothetical protein
MAKWVAMWVGSIVAFVIFVIVTQSMLEGDREFLESGDQGFKLLYPKDLNVTGIHLLIDIVDEPTKILFFFVADVENRKDHSLLAIQIPYSGRIVDNSDWDWKPLEDSTLLVKEFDCTPEKPCSYQDNIQYFEFDLDKVIDQKQSFRHSLRLWFSQTNMLLDLEIPKLIKQFNLHKKPYNTGFNDVESAIATIIFDKSADSFAATPIAPIVPGPRPNTIQLDWDIEGGRLHQIDYQLPIERKVESQMLYYTALFGIGLGITNLAIFGADQRSRQVRESKERGDSK